LNNRLLNLGKIKSGIFDPDRVLVIIKHYQGIVILVFAGVQVFMLNRWPGLQVLREQ